MTARLIMVLAAGWLVAAGGRLRAVESGLPADRHGLHFTNAVTTWDEALPLGNGILGALEWGDGQPLKISLDRTDLWDLSPVPEFHGPEYRYATMRRWHAEGRHAELVRWYEAPYNRPAPTKILAGRIELTVPVGAGFRDTSLALGEAVAAVRRIVEASMLDLDRLGSGAWCGYSFAWLASLAARARDGDKAARALDIFATACTLRNGFHCNGDQPGLRYSSFRYRPFTLEGNFAAAAGLQEMLLQSHRGRIEVFPAVPASWRDVAFRTLRAQGAFLVSAERREGVTRRVEIFSERVGRCRVVSPWDGVEQVLEMEPGESRVLAASSQRVAPTATGGRAAGRERMLAARILADAELVQVLDQAKALLKTGLTAGSGYGEVWIRDLNTFIEVALGVNPAADLRGALLTFFRFQAANGDVPDGYIPRSRASVGYKYRESALSPGLLAHKNTVETDQETSLVQAVRKYVAGTGDLAFLRERVAERTVLERLELALEYVLSERLDGAHGLVWGATTADWGDVQPEHEWGVELDASSHRALDIYDNAMFAIAVQDLLQLLGPDLSRSARWRRVHAALERNVRRHLWDRGRQKYRPHVYLGGSPFPAGFDEAAVYYHGGTAVAIEAGFLTPREVRAVLGAMRSNVRAAGASSLGLTLYPVYPEGYFKNRSMGPYSYQNGGDWCWFGGRMIQQLVARGMVREAYDELKPMVERVVRHGDFYEWWSLDNQPRGSKQYRGSAGVLGKAIEMLLEWAEQADGSEKRVEVRESTQALRRE